MFDNLLMLTRIIPSLIGISVASAVILSVVELVSRYGLGLGTPPLSISHPTIEYLFKPSQEVMRFGNRFKVNSYGMRSEEFPLRPVIGEKRVLVFGDSVVVGGAQLDQRFIATEVLKQRLAASSSNSVVTVGNVSAGSWGPGNWLAWLKQYGHLGASTVILVLSSHDLEDHPTFGPLSPLTHPQQNPPFATHELFARYLNLNSALNKLRSLDLFRRVIPSRPVHSPSDLSDSSHSSVSSIEMSDSQMRGLTDLRNWVAALRANGVRVGVVQFWERDEMMSRQPRYEHGLLLNLFQELGVPVVQSAEFFRRCSAQPAVDLYVDRIHPYTEAGQKCLADAMEAALNSIKPLKD